MRKYISAAMLVLVALGCGSSETDVAAIIQLNNDSNGKRLANLYYMYQSMNPRLTGPKNDDDFRKFIQSRHPSQLTEMGVDRSQLEELFVSERDGEPFVIRYGVKLPGSGGGHHQAVVFERQGVDGKAVVFLTGPQVKYVPFEDVSEYREGAHDQLSLPPERLGE